MRKEKQQKKSCLPQAWVKCEIVLGGAHAPPVLFLLLFLSPYTPPLNPYASSFASPLSLRTAQWEPLQDTVQSA